MKEIPDGLPLPAPLVRGADLLAMGLAAGPVLGKCLREAYDAQLNLQLRSRKQALAWARDKITQDCGDARR
jgi:hypothetical protein